ncbi:MULTISPECIES: thioesterase II family protein [Actinomadura]|uniref:Thioesterase II family protein n=1 Tax=Actinomadura yumaensis TaxID=111807 RepID=A0ABW2CDD0_9ACTN|nr:alpha/beta fold hydrolase [Actinomadura sp. J1-007]MWK38421.1 alpha/beta fold hydrolase [Actinomadura sp. J1-007]
MVAHSAPSQQWLRCLDRRPSARWKLICFPYAGAGASVFHPLAEALPATTEPWAVQYPAREDRATEPAAAQLVSMAADISYALQWLNEPPSAFLGHSMGAVVAYETIRRMSRIGLSEPSRLFVSACASPDRFGIQQGDTGRSALEPGKAAQGEERTDDPCHERLDDRAAELVRLSGTGTPLLDDPKARALVVSAVEHDLRMIERYRHHGDGALSCPITAFVAEADPDVRPAQAQGWNAFTDAEFDLESFAGDHFYLFQRLADVAASIARHTA